MISRFVPAAICSFLVIASAPFHMDSVEVARAQPTADTFVGQVSGTDAFVGIVSDGNNVTAYVCDGASDSLGNDFHGMVNDASDGVLTLQADNGTQLSINADASSLPDMLAPGQSLTGSVTTTDGNTYSFSTEVAVPPAGIFLVAGGEMLPNGAPADGGWVVLNTGEVRGVAPFGPPFGRVGHSAFLPSLASTRRPSTVVPNINFAQTATLMTTQTTATTTTTTPLAVTTAQTTTFTQNLTQTFVRGGGTLPIFPSASGSVRVRRVSFP